MREDDEIVRRVLSYQKDIEPRERGWKPFAIMLGELF